MRVLSAVLAADDKPATLLGRAILPSDAYQPGPPSGAFITGDNGVTPPFPGQPIPGFSAVLDVGHGTFWAMPDNGYGAKANSGDLLLRLYRIQPDFKTADGGTGTVAVLGFVQLRDPDGKVPFALFRSDRLLTGADFDLESVRAAKDGSFWFGEEFGVGDPFSFPLQSVESPEVLGGERLLIANDNNDPSSDGRWTGRDRPDDTELIVVRAPALH